MKNNKRQRRVSQPAVQSSVMRNTGALQRVRIKHREMVRDITGTEFPLVQQLSVNPGLPEVFPWLSAVANRFESYVFNSLKFIYIPAVGTDVNGSLTLAPDYDASDDNSTVSKRTLLAYEDAVRGPLWTQFAMVSKTRNLKKRKTYYTRSEPLEDSPSPLTGSKDAKFYDTALLCMLLNNPAELNDEPIGELWVEYDVTLITPQIEPNTEDALLYNAGNWNITSQGMYSDFPIEVGNSTLFNRDNGNALEFYRPGFWRLIQHAYSANGWANYEEVLKGVGDGYLSNIARALSLDNTTVLTDTIFEALDTTGPWNPFGTTWNGNNTTDGTLQKVEVTLQPISEDVYLRLLATHLGREKLRLNEARKLLKERDEKRKKSQLDGSTNTVKKPRPKKLLPQPVSM